MTIKAGDQVKINDEVIFTFTELHLLAYQHHCLDVDAEIKRRLLYIIEKNSNDIFGWVQNEWSKKLSADPTIKSVPNDRTEYLKFVMSHPDYKTRQKRHEEEIKQSNG